MSKSKINGPWPHAFRFVIGVLVVMALAGPIWAQIAEPGGPVAEEPNAGTCQRILTAKVVALDQPYFWNRLGAVQPHGMMYALRRDVEPLPGYSGLQAGRVRLRPDKRPRPLVLRMNVGDCLTVEFTNLLDTPAPSDNKPLTTHASIRAIGMQLVDSIDSDGSWVGKNPNNSMVPPNGTAHYTWHAQREGTHLLYNGGAMVGGEGDGGSIGNGLFGAINVEPRKAEWYRSQLTAQEMAWASVGLSATGHPILNYNAVYPAGHRFAGAPIIRMTQASLGSPLEIIHSDLTAIITGPNRGNFPAGTYPPNPVYPQRHLPFREFTIIFHDELGAVQAFPEIFDKDINPVLAHTTHSTRDAFAINYGTGGIGSEIYANRIGVGPMRDCVECKYEEFFLSSWTVGDPAQVVDIPANATCPSFVPGTPGCQPRATKVLYPDDPSNVYHSYLNEHVKFRNVLAGSDDHHIFHLHAHQWLHTPDSDKSTYLDSQAIGQGTSFTYEITNGGSGNINRTAGDSIFHCHFYPHFAQGMWSMWRVHDVFETGTPLDVLGRPLSGARALPDAEILEGTPIPALVPLPGYVMAPMPQRKASISNGQIVLGPGDGNPGYPFFIPGEAGHRPPTPPLDVLDDGGLPRHVITDGDFWEVHTRLDFTKILEEADAYALPSSGTQVEEAAMRYHASNHPSIYPTGVSGTFVTNGKKPIAGAPYADPCPTLAQDVSDAAFKTYKAANIEMDVILNKKGWHFPQQRFISLWEDVDSYLNGNKPPEPLFFRAHSGDCVVYHHTNLVPNIYELDDFQVRTPTDILGQHIHLVKFDVTASDGGANGWNYEDGTLSPDEVRERIHAINLRGGLRASKGSNLRQILTAQPHPFFGSGHNGKWLGAQTTIQRWWADPVLDNDNNDRTLRTVFTHDHFGPSTHQQVGLYAGLVVEPAGTDWFHSETGVPLYTRTDGGPTTWQAAIENPDDPEASFREFMFEFSDFQLAYWPNEKEPLLPYPHRARQPGEGFDDPDNAVNPPARKQIGLPFLYERPRECPGGVKPPCPELISADDPGTFSVNYRNEPVALRVRDPQSNTQAPGLQGDLSYAYASMHRADQDLNTQPNFYDRLTKDQRPTDPFTPLLRAFEEDPVIVKILVGGQEEEHNFSVHGLKWLFEPADDNSGFRNSQMMGISEQFNLEIPALPAGTGQGRERFTDFLYKTSSSVDGQWNGVWGIIRGYRGTAAAGEATPLKPLNANPNGRAPSDYNFLSPDMPCPAGVPVRNYKLVAVQAATALPGGKLVYNSRNTVVDPGTLGAKQGPLVDPTAILFLRASDYNFNTKKIKSGVPIEPLILRANAGDCITVELLNEMPAGAAAPDLDGFNAMPNIIERFNANQVNPSNEVGLHPQLVFFDPANSDGQNVGFNDIQTVAPTGTITYRWFAGEVRFVSGQVVTIPIEFGATNLMSSDPIKHSNKGAIGALIIEPQGSRWIDDYRMSQVSTLPHPDMRPTRAAATVFPPNGKPFREFVTLFQTDLNLRYDQDNSAVKHLAVNEDAGERGQKAINYRTEPLWFRLGYKPETPPTITRTKDYTRVLSNSLVGGDPETPVFIAEPGSDVRFRVLSPGGHTQNGAFELRGHIWEEEPYVNGSHQLGANPLSEWQGSIHGLGPSSHYDVLVKNGAGGAFEVTGDYLFRDYVSWMFHNGSWGILRVDTGGIIDHAKELVDANIISSSATAPSLP
ncbi:MAG TPA: copper oxidase [Acidobacteriota bacterium]|nr:copper oxidase [Acidobacteriota bacterium]